MSKILSEVSAKEILQDKIKEIDKGLQTAYVDSDINSNLAYRPEFITNNYKQGKKVLSSIEEELKNCEEFCISVAFITMSGITPLLQVLKELEDKNIPGKILTTDYLTFSEPAALEKLASLKNIKLKMFHSDDEAYGFHTKGYIFRDKEIYRIIIGSSNMTLRAITRNYEWNTKIVSTENGAFTKDIINEFKELWYNGNSLEINDFFDEYKTRYEIIKNQKKIAKSQKVTSIKQYELKPNKMQVTFINNLKKMIEEGAKRALLLSSTGTGKTYASAFALREMQPKRALFLVHREQIAKQAVKSFKRVFGETKTFGILSGNTKETNADYLFSTIQMMSKDNILNEFLNDEFDVIVIDEVHHAGACSYQKIIDYFNPKFYLGMTATPDTNNYDIYSIFNHNIACEIRLKEALEENLLCPFHYFGITDLEINGQVFDDNSAIKNFNNLVSDDRVKYIIQKAKYYGYSGDRVKGLIFCSTKKEAYELSNKFNLSGYKTEVLTGEDNQDKRERIIEKLVSDEAHNHIDYIFTVDIFNEGVDIPEINQVIMLRPTKSPIVFIQQLGRGLRKVDGKEFVVILDFIGNYMNNFMIPIALSGDCSRNKDNLRHYIAEGTRVIPGSSTIHFDEITRERIYRSINDAKLNKVEDIKKEYKNLRNKLGRIPTYSDFEEYNTIDMQCLFENDNIGSYHNFLKKYENDYTDRDKLNEIQEEMLVFVSKKLSSGKRIDELIILKKLLCYNYYLIIDYKNDLSIEKHDISNRLINVYKMLTNDFVPIEPQKKKFSNCVFVEISDNKILPSKKFKTELSNEVFVSLLNDLIDYGILCHKKYYSNLYKDTDFVLYQKYTKSEVCRLLKWEKNQNPQNIGGYFFDKKTKTLPIFVTYKKDDDVINTQNYEDRFVSDSKFISISKSGRNLKSKEMDYFYSYETKIYLFMQKNSNDKGASEYYFLGQLFINAQDKNVVTREDIGDTVLEFSYNLDIPVRKDLYEYFSHDDILL